MCFIPMFKQAFWFAVGIPIARFKQINVEGETLQDSSISTELNSFTTQSEKQKLAKELCIPFEDISKLGFDIQQKIEILLSRYGQQALQLDVGLTALNKSYDEVTSDKLAVKSKRITLEGDNALDYRIPALTTNLSDLDKLLKSIAHEINDHLTRKRLLKATYLRLAFKSFSLPQESVKDERTFVQEYKLLTEDNIVRSLYNERERYLYQTLVNVNEEDSEVELDSKEVVLTDDNTKLFE